MLGGVVKRSAAMLYEIRSTCRRLWLGHGTLHDLRFMIQLF